MDRPSPGDAYKLSRVSLPISRQRGSPNPQRQEADVSLDIFEDIELQDHALEDGEQEQRGSRHEPLAASRFCRANKYLRAAAWWEDEYWCSAVCLATAAGIVLLLHHYDNQLVPELIWGIQIDTAIIAMVTVVRVSLKAIVEAAISQGAWIWVSDSSQRRSSHHARFADFKLFDDASRGL
jgi:hypothetical protein